MLGDFFKKLFTGSGKLPKEPAKKVPSKIRYKKAGEKVKIKKHLSLRKKTQAKRKKRFARREGRESKPLASITKYANNPVIAPDEAILWRSWQTFNPAAVYLEGKIHLLYRAIGDDGVSRFGYANSFDGFSLDEHPRTPAYREQVETVSTVRTLTSGGSFAGCEDPRMVYVKEDDRIYITYTSCVNGLRVALSSITREDLLAKRWIWKPSQHISAPHEVHKNWVLFPEKINGKYAIIHALSPLSIAYVDSLDFNGTHVLSHYSPGKSTDDRWDSYIRGAGPPPIKTDYGWLLFYHAMSHRNMSEYKVGAMLLDLDDPTHILCRSYAPVLAPEELYETHGYKGGVVYVLGAVVKDGTLLLYYGSADSYVCVAYADFNEFLSELRAGEVIKPLQRRAVKRPSRK